MLVPGQVIFNQPKPPQLHTVNQPVPEVGNHHKLEGMVKRSHTVLLEIHAKFPFDLFPDCLTIDENKVNYIQHEFGFERLHTIFIENISYVTVDTTPYAATLNITDSTSERFPVLLSINWLNKKDAYRARKLIHGLIAAKKSTLNLEDFEPHELARELEELGEATAAEG